MKNIAYFEKMFTFEKFNELVQGLKSEKITKKDITVFFSDYFARTIMEQRIFSRAGMHVW